ncbi:hypothetical protein D3Z35_15400 [Enterococcus faecalis]|uniref:hypothetical protein n=1 Tax=Enterococcus faecalis TaxID=1351 RepID=UPI00080C5A4B|nr:hypothetical protein [Enterococcus faecalis]ANU71980.1 hypothetical protein A4V06_02440 [Enterococcus faecalis]ASU26679.1 hypothetical protein ADH73_11785 [Enterococcus faecalis]MCR1938322.1 hypothetical protein [Enterococcus faecalis]NBH39841.1 hypothetical protein [Enterococcus faecalis]QQR11258.1 hypothetical protein I5Q89_09605 [Enterococcus faecalis]
MGLFSRKPKFIYEFSGCESFRQKEVKTPYELVTHIIDEDNRFRRDYLKGNVTITKVKNDLKAQVYYSEVIHLPQEESFNWLDALSPFFTKKPLTYSVNETLVSDPDHEAVEKEEQDSKPLTLEDFESELFHTEKTESVSEPVSEEVTVPSESMREETREKECTTIQDKTSETPDMIQVSKEVFEALQTELKEQREEMNRLTRNLQSMNITELVEPAFFTEKVITEREESQAQLEQDKLSEHMEQLTTVSKHDAIVQDVLLSTKAEVSQVLMTFVEKETAKIKEEIQELDKRGLIKEEFTKRLKMEEEQQLNELSQQLSKQKEESIQEENLRHQQRLQEIDQVFQNKSEEQVEAIKTTYKNKLDSSIKEEYDKQTEQLSRILQGKMDELQLRQQAINTSLESNFKEALAEFNREHSQVIEEVERKKQHAPIDLVERRKLKQA